MRPLDVEPDVGLAGLAVGLAGLAVGLGAAAVGRPAGVAAFGTTTNGESGPA